MCGFLVSMRIGTGRHRKLAAAVVLAGFLAVTGLGVAPAAPARAATSAPALFAHAALASTFPAEGSVVPKQPEQVTATFDEPMSAQQLAFARLRAVEHDRYVVVAGTVGISAMIAPDGRVLARTGFFEPAYLDAQLRLKSSLTPATRWGPIVQGLLVSLGVAVVAGAMLHNGRFVRRRKPVTDAAKKE